MEQAYITLTSYLRNAPLAASLSDPLAACSRLPAEADKHPDVSRGAPPCVNRGDFGDGGWQRPPLSQADGPHGGERREGDAMEALNRSASTLSDTLWAFHEKMKQQWSQLQLTDDSTPALTRGTSGEEKEDAGPGAAKDLAGGCGSPHAADAWSRSAANGSSPTDGLASPLRENGFLSAAAYPRRPASLPPAGDTECPVQDLDSRSGSPASARRDGFSKHPARSSAAARCLAAAAAPSGEDNLALGLAPLPPAWSSRDPAGVQATGGRAAHSPQSAWASAAAAATAAQAAAIATHSLAEAYRQLRKENRKTLVAFRKLRVAGGLQLALCFLGMILRPWSPPHDSAGEETLSHSALWWVYMTVFLFTAWYLYGISEPSTAWEERQAQETLERLRQHQESAALLQVDAVRTPAGAPATRAAREVLLKPEEAGDPRRERRRSSAQSSVYAIPGQQDVPQPADAPPPPVETWPQRPVLLRATEEAWIVDRVNALAQRHKSKRWKNTHVKNSHDLPAIRYPSAPLLFMRKELADPTQAVHRFENPFFRGVVVIRVAAVGESPGGATYTDSKKRCMQACVQGQFLQPHRVGEVLTGQVFSHALKSLPPRWMVSLGMKVVKRLTNTLKEDITSEHPYFLTPAVCVAQTVHVAHAPKSISKSESGESRRGANGTKAAGDAPSFTSERNGHGNFYIAPPDVMNPMIEEDTRLLGGPFASGGVSSETRKNMMGEKKLLKELVFSPDYIYTFDFFQNIFYPSSYEFDLGISRIDLSPFLNRQPIELMALLDDSFIRDERPTEGGITANNASKQENSEDEDVSKWQPPPGSWKFLWRYQLWHEKLLLH
ncbi:hypothetical protein BESB_017720 [Besnoitia besnoiti]|uniref:Domain of unknown function at the cortex 1 domain-containing protein n=1 Tax=Besnoitia besnoiti TaxID=94643 RepID=A0A2A9M5H9_BESBE|nr:hypothetical protein BESB_017720 [Besnoitia besnoiti]PFH32454.1 hypothetical protein BESB_017720 [Besnoitia besnoiti]